MAIKITKKRNVEAPRPDPIVEPEAPVETTRPPLTPYREPTICRFCEHPYIEPCHGESDTCMNAKWKRERLAREGKK